MKIWSPRVGSSVVFFQPRCEFRLPMSSLTGSGTVSTILLISMIEGSQREFIGYGFVSTHHEDFRSDG